MKKTLVIALLLFFSFASTTKAQLTVSGNDPASVRWSNIKGPAFNVIYPMGLDSLAKAYSISLESYKGEVSKSLGFVPNQNYKKPLPTIIHAYNSYSNGVVTWTPRRLELYSSPQAYSPDPLPWMDNLVIHESRHVAQMQFTNHKGRKFWQYLTGELASGAFVAIYPGPAFLEGDAVVAETALTNSGRGRSADFLEYYMVSLDNGDWRNWYKWRYSSQKHYTPDYYRVGYMTFAGMRTVYDEPLFTKKYFDRMFRHKAFNVPFFNFQHTVKEVSGKRFPQAFREIEESFLKDWEKGYEERGPFMPSQQLSKTPRRFESLTGNILSGGSIYSIRSGINKPNAIMKDGKEYVGSFASSTGSLMWSEPLQRFYWSETIPDLRWEMKSSSDVRTMNADGTSRRSITHGKKYFNPAPSPNEGSISASEYLLDGRTAVCLIDGNDGTVLFRWLAPDSIQVVETAWYKGSVIASGISKAGFGLYVASDGFREVLSPQPVKIKQLRNTPDGDVCFVSDRTGVNELYALDCEDGKTVQMTNTRYGASDFVFKEDSLFYSSLRQEGRVICATALSELPVKEVDFRDIHHYDIADELSEQEKGLETPAVDTVSEPSRRYCKAGHLIHFHSWAPVYFNYDKILNLSLDKWYLAAGVGATALFQNDLSTFYGMIGYSAHENPDNPGGGWLHSGHLKLTYSGWYPVLEASIDLGDEVSKEYYRIREEGTTTWSTNREFREKPLFEGNFSTYIPFTLSSGGWQRGIIPQISYNYTNNYYSPSTVVYKKEGDQYVIVEADIHDPIPMQQMIFSLRGYTMRPVASSGIYPRLGIGAQVILREFMGKGPDYSMTDIFSPNFGAYVYGYVPGIVPEHGLKLTALYQSLPGDQSIYRSGYLSTSPRGFTSSSYLSRTLASLYPHQFKFTADYAMAIAPVDWSFLCPVTYIRNFELTAHFDYGYYFNSAETAGLYSAGLDLVAHLGNLLWIPYDTRIGVSTAYNGGRSYDYLATMSNFKRFNVGFLFSIDF